MSTSAVAAPVEHRINVSVSGDVKAAVEALAALRGRTAAAEVRDAIDWHLTRNAAAVRYATRPAAELVTVVGEDGRRIVRAVGRDYGEAIAQSVAAATGETLEIVPETEPAATAAAAKETT